MVILLDGRELSKLINWITHLAMNPTWFTPTWREWMRNRTHSLRFTVTRAWLIWSCRCSSCSQQVQRLHPPRCCGRCCWWPLIRTFSGNVKRKLTRWCHLTNCPLWNTVPGEISVYLNEWFCNWIISKITLSGSCAHGSSTIQQLGSTSKSCSAWRYW